MKTLESIFYHKAKRTPPIELQEATLVKNKGLVGDYHYGDTDKQLTISDVRTINWMTNSVEKGLCFERFFPNLIVDDLSKLSTNDVIGVGSTKLVVTKNYKDCYAKKCHLYNKGSACRLREHVMFLKVLKGGMIHVKDNINLIV